MAAGQSAMTSKGGGVPSPAASAGGTQRASGRAAAAIIHCNVVRREKVTRKPPI
jgi:hypothetical protein